MSPLRTHVLQGMVRTRAHSSGEGYVSQLVRLMRILETKWAGCIAGVWNCG